MLGGVALAVAGAATAHAKTPPATRPNVVVIVLDDVGFSDLGAFGSEICTPHMDAIAADGLRFNRFDTKALCSPTRAALLTGRNNQTVGMADLPTELVRPDDHTKDRGELAKNAETLAEALRRGGYATLAFGKWHLSPEPEDGRPGANASLPLQRGFDRFYGFLAGWTDQYHPDLVRDNAPLPKPDAPDYHVSPDLIDRTIEGVEAVRSASAEKPFFAYVALGAAHAPIQVPRPYIEGYAGVYEKGWDAIREERFARMKRMGVIPPDTRLPPRNPSDKPWSELTEDERVVFARYMAVYAGFMTHADDQIGRLVARLKAMGVYDDTLIVLMSDNGAASEAGPNGTFQRLYREDKLSIAEIRARLGDLGTDKTQSEYPKAWAMAGVTPLRRYKAWPYAGGVRAPLIVSYPKLIRDRGAIRPQFLDVVDLAPTIADFAGVSFADTLDGVRQIPLAGRSMRKVLVDPRAPGRAVQFFELRGHRAITSGPWRAVAMHRNGEPFDHDRWELFDLSKDFSESTDLSAQQPEKLSELKALWFAEARKYSTPALSEMLERYKRRSRYEEFSGTTP